MAAHEMHGTVPLGELRDFKVADGAPDVRGWDVVSENGQKVGTVKELLVSPDERRVRYLAVELDRSAGGHQTLVPVGSARLDEKRDHVVVQGATLTSLQGVTGYAGGAPTREYETSLRERLGIGATGAATGAYAGEHFDEDRLYGSRHRLRDAGERRLVLVEEELAISKRQVQAGEATVRKHVETEHVRERVPVTREEVEIERHPVSADSGLAAGATIGEDEIRVPLMEEQVVAEKRAVPKEEVVVRKKSVTGEEVVEDDLRRERVDVDDETSRVRADRADRADLADDATTRGTGRTGRGVGQRLADAVDDVKDRVDNDPRSRPGPDPTDRRV